MNEADQTQSTDNELILKDCENKKIKLLDLPNEMLAQIFKEMDSAGDRVCFQLTCHKFATTTTAFKLRQAPPGHYGTAQTRLIVLKSLKPLMPTDTRLCRLCMKYLKIMKNMKNWKTTNQLSIAARGFIEHKPSLSYELWKKFNICPTCQYPVVPGTHIYNSLKSRGEVFTCCSSLS